MTGVLAACLAFTNGNIVEHKLRFMEYFLYDLGLPIWVACLQQMIVNVLLVLIGATMVLTWAPSAAGGGVTLVMAYLNGNYIPDLFSPRTLITKWIGTVCSVSSSLAAGPEAPMVHMGSCTAHIMANLPVALFEKWCGCVACKKKSRPSRVPEDGADSAQEGSTHTDRVGEPDSAPQGLCGVWDEVSGMDAAQREFVSAGAASGLSAAFGAPIGGVLFSLEEATSYWSKAVMWRSLLATVLAAMTLAQFRLKSTSGLVQLEGVIIPSNKEWFMQTPFIITAAALAALMGAWFHFLRRSLWRVRPGKAYKLLRILECAAVSVLSTLLAFCMAIFFGRCMSTTDAQQQFEEFRAVRLTCPEGSYNDLATLFMDYPEKLSSMMFSVGQGEGGVFKSPFSWPSLLIYTATYSSLMALTSGLAVPCGMFMPAILVGSSVGLTCGLLLRQWLPLHWHIQEGIYALVGATAALAAVFRSSISLIVIIIEGTMGVSFIFGIMISVLISNAVNELLNNEGVYESELERDGTLHFLHPDPSARLTGLRARDIMAADVLALAPVESLERVITVLRWTSHHGFPVLDKGAWQGPDVEAGANGNDEDGPAGDTGRLAGLVLRA